MYNTIPSYNDGLNAYNLSNSSSDNESIDEESGDISSDDISSDDVSNNFNSYDSMLYYRTLPNDNYLPIPIILLLLIPLLFFGFMPLMC